MPAYSYLVLGVNPTSNESNVDLSSKITVTFAKHIDTDTLNSNTVRLRIVNGDFVDYTGRYDNLSKTYTITPRDLLSPNTQYQIIILGGVEGVLSIDNSYLPSTKTYEFVTVEKEGIKALENLVLKQDYYFVSAQWSMPSGLTIGEEIYFNVRLSTSNNPEAFDLWPINPLEGKTTSPNIIIPYRLDPGRSYYVHVQGVTKDMKTEWIGKQIYIEDINTRPSVPTPPPPTTPPSTNEESNSEDEEITPPIVTISDQLSIEETFPESDQMEKPSEIIIVFSHDIPDTLFGPDQPEVNPLLYVVQAPYKSKYSLIDLRGKHSVNNALKGTISIDSDNPNILIWTPLDGASAFQENKEYTVFISKDMVGNDSLPMGYTHSFGFIGTPEHLHGDIEHIKETLSFLGMELSTTFLQSLMRKYSQYACDIWYEASTYDESLHENGDAPYYIHQYVNTQVLFDSIINGGAASAATGGANSGGDETIKLGELSITKKGASSSENSSSSGASISSILSQLQSRIKTWEDLIHGHHNRGYARPGAVTKGESVAVYPEFLTRSELTTNFDE